jgi:conjugative relaxase-like TrwC/TraI family protein
MLRIVVQQNTATILGAYFAGGKGDYYAQGLEVTGLWGGKAASELGLKGAVERETFEALCQNLRPGTSEPLTPRTNADRRVGYDFTFNCPKSLSVLYGLSEAPELLAAFQEAVAQTMQEAQAFAETRVRLNGEDYERRTGNFLWATFVHTTARPVAHYPDPHLHAHVFVFNVTLDPVERRWKAASLALIKENAPYFEAAFHARLAWKLRTLGYDVTATATGWEIAGIPDRLLRSFSRRTELIDAIAQEQGITDARVKDALGAQTRNHKQTDLDAQQLRQLWWSLLTPEEERAVRAVLGKEVLCLRVAEDSAQRAVVYAAEHHFERQSVVSVNRLLATALRYGVGQIAVEEGKEALSRLGLLLPGQEGESLATSEAILQEEQRMLNFAREGRGGCPPLGVASRPLSRSWLSEEQQRIVRSIQESTDRVLLIRGAAGTGKTALMQEAVEVIEASGKRVFPLAPSAEASRGVLRAEGFADADTVARFLLDTRRQEGMRGQVLWIDEAGLLGSRTIARLFDIANHLGARVILSGDDKQHASVERGAVFRLLQTEAGLPILEVSEVRRQRGEYKRAAQYLGNGQTLAGFEVLDQLGWIREGDTREREGQLVEAVLEAITENKSFLIVSPTHAEGRKATSAIRTALREQGLLASEERRFLRLEAKGWTVAERKNPRSYEVGDVVEFHQNAPGFVKSGRYTVTKLARASALVKDEAGQERILPLAMAERFDVYAPRELPLAVGDRIRVTKNGRANSLRLDNGTLLTVTGFTTDGDIRVKGGGVLSRSYAHLTHGYVVTSHASQGKTVDRVFVVQGAESFRASSREQFYVSATRARERLLVFTDDKEGLRRAIMRSDPRPTATELLHLGENHPAWLAWRSRRSRILGVSVESERPVDREVTR